MADIQHIKRRLGDMRAERIKHEQVWKDCFDVTFPSRAHGLQSQIVGATDAQARKSTIYDGTAPDACKTGTATLMGSMVPSNALWFGIDIGDQATDEERAFLDTMARFMWVNLHASNFDAEAFDGLLDNMVAGWFVLYQDEAPEGGYYFELWPLGECYIEASRRGGRIDTVYREFDLTVSQCVAEYGLEKVSTAVREKFQADKLDEKVRIVHAIEPRSVYAVGAKMAKNLAFASCHVDMTAGVILRESGYHEFPCMVPRWARLPGSPYATGPMSDALPDVRTLNEVVKWGLLGAETAIAPPMIAVDDGVLNTGNIRMGPRKLIVANDVDSIKPLITGAKVEFAEVKAERLQSQVRKVLLADQLPPADGPVKTAYEWSVRVETMRKMLGPMFARFQAEFLQVLVERTFGITWRANEASRYSLVGKPPESLRNRTFSVRYLSPLARSQRLEDVAAMDRYELALAQESQIDPSVLDVYDLEAAARERGHLLGVPQKLIRDKRATATVRKGREAAQAEMQQQQVATQGQLSMQDAMAQRAANAA